MGSSPRVRGKRGSDEDRVHPPGLIPARAGKTDVIDDPAAAGLAHPRACGENSRCHFYSPSSVGSSPRVRGKPGRTPCSSCRAGLIPARAGKTAVTWIGDDPRTAHPRACGENAVEKLIKAQEDGSSPRVRGKRSGHSLRRPSPGLIPARAGKTGFGTCSTGILTAHPRACGENSAGDRARAINQGSSPRVRGKPRPHHSGPAHHRLIPARAGKTGPTPGRNSPSRAHPRACGENL